MGTEEDSRIVSALENLGMDEGHDWKASIKKYCAHGDYGQGLKESQPILKELKAGVKEFDKCMKCVCKHGVDHCVDRPLCIRSFEGITQVAGSISKAKGFLNENGELIEPLGQKHYAAMKKKELHKRHGPNPTKKQFHEVISENDEQSLVQVQGCHGMSAATAIEFKSGAISCGFDCNEYHGVQEASLSCTAFEVVKVEIGVTFSPLTLFLKLKLCAPGVSDVIGEIQKIPCVNAILSKFGLDGGCLLLGIGYIDFTNGIGEIKPGINGLLSVDFFKIVKAQLSARAFFRCDSALPSNNPYSQDCHRNDFQPLSQGWMCGAIAPAFGGMYGSAKHKYGYTVARDWWRLLGAVGKGNLRDAISPMIHRAEY